MSKHLPRIIAITLIQAIIITFMCLDKVFMVLVLCIYVLLGLMYLVGVAMHNTFNIRKWGSIHGGW